MTTTALVSADAGPEEDLAGMPVERLEAELVGWNAQLSAATCRWLMLVGEFDRRQAWEAWECHNCAHYLDWICGIDRRLARAPGPTGIAPMGSPGLRFRRPLAAVPGRHPLGLPRATFPLTGSVDWTLSVLASGAPKTAGLGPRASVPI